MGTGGWVVVSPGVPPSRRDVVPASSSRLVVAATARCSPRRDRVVAGLPCTWVHLPHQRRRLTPPRRRVVASSPVYSPHRYPHLFAATCTPPCRRRRVAFARVGMAPAWGGTNTSPCPSAHVFSSRSFVPDWNVVSCRVHVCAAPRRPRRAPPCRVPCRAPCRRAPWQAPCRAPVVHPSPAHSRVRVMHRQCTGPAPATRVVLSPPRRRRVVTSSSRRSLTPARQDHGVVASSSHRGLVVVVVLASSSLHGIPAVSLHGIPYLVRRGFTRYPRLSPRLYSILASLTRPHPILTRLGSGVRTRIRKPLQRGPAASTQ